LPLISPLTLLLIPCTGPTSTSHPSVLSSHPALSKCATTQYGKSFLPDNKLPPANRPSELSLAARLQATDSHFFGQSLGSSKGFYSTSHHFPPARTQPHAAPMAKPQTPVPPPLDFVSTPKLPLRPNSSRVRSTLRSPERSQLSRNGPRHSETDTRPQEPLSALSKGIVTSKQDRDKIPIKTMFGNDEDRTHRLLAHTPRLEDDGIEAEALGNPLSHRREAFLEDERERTNKTAHPLRALPLSKVQSKGGSGVRPCTAPKLAFESSLSPDFLNLFAH
jgi:hypothetical protein